MRYNRCLQDAGVAYVCVDGHRKLGSRKLAFSSLGDLINARQRLSGDEELLSRRRVVHVHETAVLVPLFSAPTLEAVFH